MPPNNISLTLLHKFLPNFTAMLAAIPAKPEDETSGTQLVKTFAEAIANKLAAKDPDQLVADHHTDLVFEPHHEPSAKTIKRSWWDSSDSSRPQWLVRALFPLGPANQVTPAHFNRTNQGILCQPSAETGLRPIEYIAHHVNRAFCRANKMDAEDVMTDLVDIFTNQNTLDDDVIDNLNFVFVTGKAMTEVQANRLDLVHAIRLLFFTGYLIYFTNPTAFKWAHPVFLITAVFQAQTNFFPNNKDLNHPLSDAHKSNYLLALGLNVFEAIRKPFDADFFNSADLFPPSINPTNMPQPLGLAYAPPPGAPPPPPDEFYPTYFLFGNQTTDQTTHEGITAELFDQDVLINYIAVRDNTDDLPQVTCRELKTLMTIICPKSALRLNMKNFGHAKKANMLDTLNEHITTFGNTHATYLHDLAATQDED